MKINKQVTTGYSNRDDSIFRHIPEQNGTTVEDMSESDDGELVCIPEGSCQVIAHWWASQLFKIGYTLPDTPDSIALHLLDQKLSGFLATTDDHRTRYITEFVKLLQEVRIPKKDVSFWSGKIGDIDVDYHAEFALMYIAYAAGIKGNDMHMYPAKTHMDIYDDGGVIAYGKSSTPEYLVKSPRVLQEIQEEDFARWKREKWKNEQNHLRNTGLLP